MYNFNAEQANRMPEGSERYSIPLCCFPNALRGAGNIITYLSTGENNPQQEDFFAMDCFLQYLADDLESLIKKLPVQFQNL